MMHHPLNCSARCTDEHVVNTGASLVLHSRVIASGPSTWQAVNYMLTTDKFGEYLCSSCLCWRQLDLSSGWL
jgi:hypothetical protein